VRRYLSSKNPVDMDRMEFDVVIVGNGVAGLYAALQLDGRLSCAVLNKLGREDSNSLYAQGGIAAVMDENDTLESHFQDTMEAGAGLCIEEAVKVLVEEGPDDIRRLLSLGVPFDTDKAGKLLLTREGAHHRNRIVHIQGDATGLYATKHLLEVALKRENLHFYDNLMLVDVVTDQNGRTAGVTALDGENKMWYFSAPHVILATGGVGHVYRNSTNARSATGDGIAAALRAGAAARDMEFVQFHPTALAHPDQSGRFFLISEALRGEGAVLRNRRSEAFMKDVHPMADLAPRDVVARAIIEQMKKYDLPYVYLDISSRSRRFLKNRFPTIYEECMRRDIDISVNWIPVLPIQHYFMGGVQTNLQGETRVKGLFVCGESASTGVHGANRLASNSLLECLVFGRRSAEYINETAGDWPKADLLFEEEARERREMDVVSFRTQLRNAMSKCAGIIRDKESMEWAIELISGFYDQLSSAQLCTKLEFETINMATVGLEILRAALRREKSIGAHYRSDSK